MVLIFYEEYLKLRLEEMIKSLPDNYDDLFLFQKIRFGVIIDNQLIVRYGSCLRGYTDKYTEIEKQETMFNLFENIPFNRHSLEEEFYNVYQY